HRASASPSTASDLLGLHSFPTRRSSDLGVLSFYNTCYISNTFDQSPKIMLDNAQYTEYTEDNIRSLDWKEHIRMRPGMYIGKLRSEEHTSELQSRETPVCRLLRDTKEPC